MKHIDVTVECPKCLLPMDVMLDATENPIFEESFHDKFKVCLNCDTVVHIAVTGNKKHKELPF